MQPLFYVIALMGCGDGSQMCQQARVEPIHYVSPQACAAAMPDALQRNTDLSYPVIEASCRASGNVVAQQPEGARRG